MSYILDALRKAEEQRRTHQPQSIPSAIGQPRPQKSRTGVFVIAGILLLLNLAVIGALFFYKSQPKPETADVNAPQPVEPVGINQSAQQPPVQQTPTAVNYDQWPLIQDLPRATRNQIPQLVISAHAYAGSNSRISFVIINGNRLQNGQSDGSGLTVVSIRQNDLAVRYNSLRFRLSINTE